MNAELEQALAAIRAGDQATGLRALTRLVDDPSSAAEALGHRAWLLKSRGDCENAISDYRALLRLRPHDAVAQGALADALALAGSLDEAFALALQTLGRDPRERNAAAAIARCQAAWGSAGSAKAFPPNESILPAIDRLEQSSAHFIGSVHPDVARLIHWLVRSVRPQLVIETGAYVGYSSLAIAAALRDNGAGHLHSFDLFRQPAAEHPLHRPTDDSLVSIVRRQAADAGLSQHVTYHQGDSAAAIDAFARSTPVLRIDMAFIDGDHRIAGCQADFLAVDRVLTSGGVILLHDTFPRECEWLGPRWLIESLREKADAKYTAVNLHTHDGRGLALLQKLGDAPAQSWRPSLGETLHELLFNRAAKGWRRP